MANAGMPQLDPTSFPSQLFWLVVVFVSLYLVMARSLAPKIHQVLETRREKLEGDLDLAAKCKSDAAKAKEHYETSLSDARAQSAKMLLEASQSIKLTAETKSRELDASLAAKITQSERQIEAARGEVMGKLTPVASEITGMVLEILLRKKVDSAAIDAAVKQSGSGVGL
jgi:F-type H+-transporting ATPase subunit b